MSDKKSTNTGAFFCNYSDAFLMFVGRIRVNLVRSLLLGLCLWTIPACQQDGECPDDGQISAGNLQVTPSAQARKIAEALPAVLSQRALNHVTRERQEDL